LLTSAETALHAFMKKESAGGIVLIFSALLALFAANTALSEAYFTNLQIPLNVSFGAFVIDKPILLWINDGFMAIFFFLVGLEVKREFVEGQLSTVDKATLPVIAAFGGIVGPALIFIAINSGSPENLDGWAIPAATDIAFALGILALLGPRVPVALKAFLLAVAVIDDMAAVTIIALFYSGTINVDMLLGGALMLAVLFGLNRLRVGSSIPYILFSLVLWVFVLKSGVHATLAGVAAALMVPMSARDGSQPLERMEHALHPWVAFLIIPIFGFANAGVRLIGLEVSDLVAPLPLGIALGLLLGKQIGVFGAAFLALKFGLAKLPEAVTLRQLHGVSLLAAIGFTMSLFIGGLAFSDPAQVDAVRLGVLSGSLIAALGGYFAIKLTLTDVAPEAGAAKRG